MSDKSHWVNLENMIIGIVEISKTFLKILVSCSCRPVQTQGENMLKTFANLLGSKDFRVQIPSLQVAFFATGAKMYIF